MNDIAEILRHIPPKDYGRLNLIILRQPKRKEEILASAWGRLIYNYEFEEEFRPAVILEAMDLKRKLKWSKKLGPDDQKELERLKEDGHEVVFDKRHHIITCSLESVRNTQLYRTLPHEFGHYKHFLELVGETEDLEHIEDDDEYDRLYAEYEKRYDEYIALSSAVKEKFAHRFADEFSEMLRKSGSIPFERMEG